MEQGFSYIEELFSEGPIVIFHWLPSPDWKVSFVTENVKELTGYTKDEWLKGKIMYKNIVDPEDLPRVIQEVQQNSLESKKTRWKHDPYRIINKKGERIWVQDYTICKYKDSAVEIYIGYVFDITKEIQYQEKIKSDFEFYFNLFEQHSAIMLLIDPQDGSILNANQSACKFYGFSKKEFLTKNIMDINTLNKEEVQLKMHQAKLKNQNTFLFKHKLANGVIKDVEVHSTPLQLKDRTVLFSIIHDISEKVQFQENLKQLYTNLENILEMQIHERVKLFKKYQFIFENINIGIGIVKKKDLIEYNQRMIQFLKPLKEEEIKYNFFDHFALPIEAELESVFKIGFQKYFYEISLKKFPNKIFHIHITPFRDWENPQEILYLVFLNDITEIKKIELEKKEKEELLLQQSKLLAIGESLTTISHQWRQPLQSIQIMTSFLKELSKEGDIQKDTLVSVLNDILEQIHFMNQTLQDFRDFYKESQDVSFFSVREEIQKVLQLVNLLFEQKQIFLSINEGDFIVCGNSNLFKQCILNLINNSKDAILELKKHNPDFLGKINIEIFPENKIIKIIDNGIGIPNDIQNKLFQPYVTTKKIEGTGLGLYITKQILNKMNADIYYCASSELEKSCTFSIKFR